MSKKKIFVFLVGLLAAFSQHSFARSKPCYPDSPPVQNYDDLHTLYQTVGNEAYRTCSFSSLGDGAYFREVDRKLAIDKTFWIYWYDRNQLGAQVTTELGGKTVYCTRLHSLEDPSDVYYRYGWDGGEGPDEDGYCDYVFKTLDAKQATAQSFITSAFVAYSHYIRATSIHEKMSQYQLALFYMGLIKGLEKSAE